MLPSSWRRKAGGPVVVALTAATAQTGLTLGELVGSVVWSHQHTGLYGHKFANPRQCQCQEL